MPVHCNQINLSNFRQHVSTPVTCESSQWIVQFLGAKPATLHQASTNCNHPDEEPRQKLFLIWINQTLRPCFVGLEGWSLQRAVSDTIDWMGTDALRLCHPINDIIGPVKRCLSKVTHQFFCLLLVWGQCLQRPWKALKYVCVNSIIT